MTAEPSPLYREVARRLLAHEAGTSGDASETHVAAALERVQAMLKAQLTAVVGDAGLDALVARSLRLCKAPFLASGPLVGAGAAPGAPELLTQLQGWLRSQPAPTAEEAAAAWLTSFLALLASLIGDALTLRLVDQAWSGGVELPRPSTEKK